MYTGFELLPMHIRARMEQYRKELIAFEMKEPTKWDCVSCHWLFYKSMTDLTAFILNLRGSDTGIEITYGYASTAFTKFAGCENSLLERGVFDEHINIREKITICNEADETTAKVKIADMFFAFQHTNKDDLLLFTKEKRKAFIQQIQAKLKPLGFRKKANSWTYTIDDTFYLMFNAQKSDFSDEYYFNIYIGKNGTNDYGDCYYTRIAPKGMFPMDWQALSKEDFDSFLENEMIPKLKKIIDTPLKELGQISSYWNGCYCDHKKCERCWMKKNMWEVENLNK